MSEHFIKEIDIKNYKLFKDFKASGFGRVNLIGGKNNVGKTAFMEACYISQAEDSINLIAKLMVIKNSRDIVNVIANNIKFEDYIKDIIENNLNIEIFIKGKGGQIINQENNHYEEWDDGLIKIEEDKKRGKFNIYTKYTPINSVPPDYDPEIEDVIDSYPEKYSLFDLTNIIHSKLPNYISIYSPRFLYPCLYSNKMLDDIISDLKLKSKYDIFNDYLKSIFNIDKIDIIKNKPMILINEKYLELSEFGQGLKSFINIVASLMLLENDIIFIDEIENGIHYTNLDKLWEIILTLSKEQNVQVFATTHSKECIESFNRVSRKLKSKEALYSEMIKNEKKDKIYMRALDVNQLEYELTHNGEFRG